MRIRFALLAATLVAGGAGVAIAQTAGIFDPGQLPAIQGKVAEYSLTPRGDVDGLLLTDGTEVHTPPHLGTQLVAAVKPGDAVTIHGLKARAIPVVQAMSVSNDATHATVVDNGPGGGPRGPRDAGQMLSAEGRIKAQLHGPRGEMNGVLLEDGTIIHLPPPEAQRLSAQLAVGAPLYAAGDGYAGPLGRVIGAQSIGSSEGKALQVAAPPPGRGHGGPMGPGEPGAPDRF